MKVVNKEAVFDLEKCTGCKTCYNVCPAAVIEMKDGKPHVAPNSCFGCNACVESCPVGAIPFEDPKMTNGEVCISCMRCVEICPQSARSGNPEKVQMISEKLKMICQPDKANEFF